MFGLKRKIKWEFHGEWIAKAPNELYRYCVGPQGKWDCVGIQTCRDGAVSPPYSIQRLTNPVDTQILGEGMVNGYLGFRAPEHGEGKQGHEQYVEACKVQRREMGAELPKHDRMKAVCRKNRAEAERKAFRH